MCSRYKLCYLLMYINPTLNKDYLLTLTICCFDNEQRMVLTHLDIDLDSTYNVINVDLAMTI